MDIYKYFNIVLKNKRLKCFLNQFKSKFFSNRFKSMLVYNTFLIIAFSIVISGVSYRFILQNIKKQTIESNFEMLEQFKNTIDKFIFDTVDQATISIYKDKNMKKDVFYYLDNSTENNIYNVVPIYDHLMFIKNTMPSIIDSVSVYYNKNNLVVSTDGMHYLSKDNDKDCIDVSWINDINLIKSGSSLWISTRKVRNPDDMERYSKNIITFIRKINVNKSEYGAIAVSIPEESLYQTILKSMPPNFGQMFVINDKGIIISHNDKDLLYKNVSDIIGRECYNYIKDKQSNGYKVTKLKDSNVVVSYSTSKYNNWKYISIKPINKFFEGYEFISSIFIYMCLAVILIWIILFVYSFNKFYKPLKSLANFSKKKMENLSSNNDLINPYEYDYDYNEYKVIDYTLNSLSYKINELENKISQNAPIIRHYLVLNIINGSIKSVKDMKNKLKMLKIDFNNVYYQTIIIKYDKASYNLNQNVEKIYDDYLNNEFIPHIMTEENGILIILLNLDNDCNTDDFMYNITGVNDHTLVGRIYSDMALLNKSFKEALECKEYIFINPSKKVISYNDISKNMNLSEKWSGDCYSAFYNAVLSKNKEKLVNEFDGILRSMEDCYLSHTMINKIIYKLVVIIFDQYKVYGITYKDQQKDTIISDFNKANDFNELKSLFNKFVTPIFEQLERKSIERNSEIIKNVKKYIEENLLNDKMDLNSIAAKFYISPSYLSKLFKEETSNTLIDYIIDCRLNKSKELLINTDLKIEKISEIIGYSNCQYFIKIFKSKYGITPKQYRLNILNK